MTQQKSNSSAFSDSLSEALIELTVEKFSSFVEEYSANISLGGMFLHSSDPKPVGTPISIEIKLSDGYRLVHAVGEVAWVTLDPASPPGAGMAIRFQALDESGRELLLKIIEEQVKGGKLPFEINQIPARAITASGALPAASSPQPQPPAAQATADAGLGEVVSSAPSSPPGTEQQPLFDAPWGTQLPDLPPEILATETPVSEEPPPLPPLAAAGRRPSKPPTELPPEDAAALGEDTGDLAAFNIPAPHIDFTAAKTQPEATPKTPVRSQPGETVPEPPIPPAIPAAEEAFGVPPSDPLDVSQDEAPVADVNDPLDLPAAPASTAETSFADLAAFTAQPDEANPAKNDIDFASLPVDFDLPNRDLGFSFESAPEDIDFGEEPDLGDQTAGSSAIDFTGNSATSEFESTALPAGPLPPAETVSSFCDLATEASEDPTLVQAPASPSPWEATPPTVAPPTDFPAPGPENAQSPSWTDFSQQEEQGAGLPPTASAPGSVTQPIHEVIAALQETPTDLGDTAKQIPKDPPWPLPSDPPREIATASSFAVTNMPGDTPTAETPSPLKPAAHVPEDLEPLTFDDEHPPPTRRRTLALAVILVLALAAAGLYWKRDGLSRYWGSAEPDPPPASLAAETTSAEDTASDGTLPQSRNTPAQTDLETETPRGIAPSTAATATPPTTVPGSAPANSTTMTAPSRPATTIESITWTSTTRGTQIVIRADGNLGAERLTQARIQSPPVRELLRFSNIEQPYVENKIAVGSRELQGIRTGYHPGNELHIVLDLTGLDIEIIDVAEQGDHLQLMLGQR